MTQRRLMLDVFLSLLVVVATIEVIAYLWFF